MPRKFGTPIDLNKFELLNPKIHVLASDPAGLVAGDEGLHWYNSTSKQLKVWNGSAATLVATDAQLLQGQNSAYHLSRANHSGTQVASTISNFDTQVRTSRLDQMAAPTAPVAMGSQKITGMADGTVATDGATYGQLIQLINNQVFKQSVRLATQSNDTLSGLAARDGVTPASGDRVLVWNQTTASANGIYIAGSGAWSRATDFDASSETLSGCIIPVEEGTASGDKLYMLTTNNPIVIGTTSLVFSAYGASTGEIGVGGAGIVKTGTTYDVIGGSGITVGADLVSVDFTVVAKKLQGVIPTTTSGAFTVSGAVVTWNHNLNNNAARPHIVFHTSPGSGNTQGDPLEIQYNNPDANNTTMTFPAAPTSNQYYGCVIG